jgi:hypothetical protein
LTAAAFGTACAPTPAAFATTTATTFAARASVATAVLATATATFAHALLPGQVHQRIHWTRVASASTQAFKVNNLHGFYCEFFWPSV